MVPVYRPGMRQEATAIDLTADCAVHQRYEQPFSLCRRAVLADYFQLEIKSRNKSWGGGGGGPPPPPQGGGPAGGGGGGGGGAGGAAPDELW